MKYVCLGDIDEGNWDSLSEAEGQRVLEECFGYDDELRKGGQFLGGEALDSSLGAVTLRMKNGQVDVTDGPYAETKEVLGGILLLEARDLNRAVSLMSKHPGVRLGPFEIRPADEQINRMVEEQNNKFADQSSDLVIRITRLVDAPAADVFSALIPCVGLNGGPGMEHTMAYSIKVATTDQAETDRYWNAIVSGGGEESQCGWCKDKWGVNWQITPIVLTQAITGPDTAAAKRVFEAMMTMQKIDIAAIEAAVRG